MSDAEFKPIKDAIYAHPLGEPIKVGSGMISEVAIRKPTSMDLLGIGDPVIKDPTSFKPATIDHAIALRMTSALSGVPERSLLQISPAELVDLFWAVGTFFIKGWDQTLPAMQRSREMPNEPSEQPAS